VFHHLGGAASAKAGGDTMGDELRDVGQSDRAGTQSGQQGTKSDSQKVSDLIKSAVDEGYKVIDKYIEEGRTAAKLIRDGLYTNSNAEADIKGLIDQWVVLAKKLSVTGLDLVSAVVRDTRLVPPSASSPSGNAPQSLGSQVAIETRSIRPVQVHCNLNATAPHFVPHVPALYSADRNAPPLTGTKFALGQGNRPVLVVEVPDQHPAGTYTGPIVNAITKEERGSVSVTILQ
jgi:hypothetical protein